MALLTSSARTRLRRAFQTRLGILHEGWSRPSFHPAGFGSESPSSTANLSRYLAIWCSAASQRVLLSGSSSRRPGWLSRSDSPRTTRLHHAAFSWDRLVEVTVRGGSAGKPSRTGVKKTGVSLYGLAPRHFTSSTPMDDTMRRLTHSVNGDRLVGAMPRHSMQRRPTRRRSVCHPAVGQGRCSRSLLRRQARCNLSHQCSNPQLKHVWLAARNGGMQ